MRVSIIAVGKARSGPERDLVETYLGRFDALGRGMALGPSDLVELDSRGGVIPSERVPDGYATILLDERGKMVSSEDIAALLCDLRDGGTRGAAFLIGGADGHGDAVRASASRLIAFGRATWPHMLVRAMLAEQLYRAASIAGNHPYHRGG